MHPIAVDLALLRDVLLPGVRIAPGRALMARVVAAETGRGSLSIAGYLIEAELPKHVKTGQQLRLEVRDVSQQRVLLQISDAGHSDAAPPPAEVPLPGGGTLTVTERDGQGGGTSGTGGTGGSESSAPRPEPTRCAPCWRPSSATRCPSPSPPAATRSTSMPDLPERRRATALRYEHGDHAPRVTATGTGLVAERIIAAAREAGVPVRADPALARALGALELDSDIPPEMWRAVAEALAWAYRLDADADADAARATGGG